MFSKRDERTKVMRTNFLAFWKKNEEEVRTITQNEKEIVKLKKALWVIYKIGFREGFQEQLESN